MMCFTLNQFIAKQKLNHSLLGPRFLTWALTITIFADLNWATRPLWQAAAQTALRRLRRRAKAPANVQSNGGFDGCCIGMAQLEIGFCLVTKSPSRN
jgi:hypothetical protein